MCYYFNILHNYRKLKGGKQYFEINFKNIFTNLKFLG